MKKGKNYRIKFYKFKTMISSGYLVYALAYIFLFVVSLVSLILNIIICCKFNVEGKDRMQDICNIIISAISLVGSSVGTIIEFNRTYRRNYFQRQFLDQKVYKYKLAKSVSSNLSSAYRVSKYSWRNYNGQRYLASDKVNEDLMKYVKTLRISVNPRKHAMGNEQREMLYKVVTKKIEQGKSIFNSNLVALRSDILESLFEIKNNSESELFYVLHCNKSVKLEKTDYYSNLTTNDLIYDRFFSFDYSSVYCGKDFTTDAEDTLYDLSQSPAANIVGVSTLAITRDGYLVINGQSNNNDVNNDCYVPSGSGSSDFEDLKKCLKYEPVELREQLKLYLDIKDNEDLKISRKNYLQAIDESFIDEGPENNSKAKDVLTTNLNNACEDYQEALRTRKRLHGLKQYLSKMKRYTYSLNTFLTYGMVRELVEESHLYENNVNIDEKGRIYYGKISEDTIGKYMANTYICGYIRILDRGGKPDFFGITLLDISKDELAKMFEYGKMRVEQKEVSKRHRITDYSEVCEQLYFKIDEIDAYNSIYALIKSRQKDGKYDKKIKCSLQIHCLYNLLKKNKDVIKSKLAELNS